MPNPIEDYNEFLKISNTLGWKAYKVELEKQIEIYDKMMDNDEADGELLKRYQLIKKGLKTALNIPLTFKVKAENWRK